METAFVILMRYDDSERNAVSKTPGLTRMKGPPPEQISIAAVLFLLAAAALVAISLITDLGEFVTAAFVISGMVCGMMGIFMLTFFSGEPIDPRLVDSFLYRGV